MPLRTLVAAVPFNQRRIVMRELAYFAVYGHRLIRDYEQGILLIPLKHDGYDLCCRVLENNRVQGFVKSEQDSRSRQNNRISQQHIIPYVHPFFLGKIDGDEIRSAAACAADERYADRNSLNNSAENRNKKYIICNRNRRKYIRQKTR